MARRARTKNSRPAEDVDGNLLKQTESRDQRWWKFESSDDLHDHLMNTVRQIRNRQRPRREMYRFYAELYGVNEVMGLGITNYDPAGVGYVAPTLPFNVVRRGVNTLLAKVAKNSVLPMVLTERGNYSQTKRARGLSNFLAGIFNRLKITDKMRDLCRDALVFGTGIQWVFANDDDKIPRVDRLFPWEFFTDVADARYGEPKHFYVMRWVDRAELLELYPDKEEDIELASGHSDWVDDIPDYEEQGDMVLVVCAWRMASKTNPEKYPGRFVIATDSVVLHDEPYKRDKPPFVFLRYSKPVIGFYGDALTGEMSGFQYEVNYVTETLRMAHRVAPTGVWITDDNTGIPDTYWNNETGLILKKRPGSEITHVNPDAASPQTYQWLDKCAEGALAWSGISSMSANAEKPGGITAAKALTTLDDIEADNFAVFEKDFEQAHLDLADLLIDEVAEMAKANPQLEMLVPDRRSLLRVKWSDVNMARDAIVMQVFPVKLLGRTPAARLQQVNDLFNAGIIDRALYLKLLDAPDIDSETDLDAAARTVCDEQIERMLDAEDTDAPEAYSRPSPYQDLVYAIHRATQQVNLAELTGVPEGNKELLRQYIADVKELLDKTNPPAVGPGVPPPPGAPPMATIGAAPPMVAPPPPTPGAPPPMPGMQ